MTTAVMQTTRIIQLMLDMIDPAQRQLVLKQVNQESGVQVDVARMYSDVELAERYNVNVRTVRIMIDRGELKGCKIGNKWHSRADWMDEYEKQGMPTQRKREMG